MQPIYPYFPWLLQCHSQCNNHEGYKDNHAVLYSYISLTSRVKGSLLHSCPDSKFHGANMGPIWGRQNPGGPHVGPMNLAIRVGTPMDLKGQMTMALHTYRPRQFQLTWFGVNRASSRWVTVFIRSQEHFLHPWTWRCISTGEESSNEFDLEWNSQVVADLRFKSSKVFLKCPQVPIIEI